MLNNSNVSYFRSFVMTKIITRAFPVSNRISLVYAYVNYRQLKSKRLPMNACTFIKTFCSCSDTRNWYVHRTSTPSLSLWHTWIYFSYDIACSIDIGIHENAVFASIQSSLDSFPCEGMRYIVSIDWYLILVNGTSLRLYCFFTDHDSDSCRFSFVFDHFDQV